MKQTIADGAAKAGSGKPGDKSEAVRVVVVPKATAAQERELRLLREWEARSELTLLDGNRYRSR